MTAPRPRRRQRTRRPASPSWRPGAALSVVRRCRHRHRAETQGAAGRDGDRAAVASDKGALDRRAAEQHGRAVADEDGAAQAAGADAAHQRAADNHRARDVRRPQRSADTAGGRAASAARPIDGHAQEQELDGAAAVRRAAAVEHGVAQLRRCVGAGRDRRLASQSTRGPSTHGA